MNIKIDMRTLVHTKVDHQLKSFYESTKLNEHLNRDESGRLSGNLFRNKTKK